MNILVFGEAITINGSLIRESNDEIKKQVKEYLNNDRESFELNKTFPLTFTGKVMKENDRIPYNETKTYGEIANKLNTAPIAVGRACGRNPLPLVVPCHRITSKNGLGGYAYGREVKEKLLRLEQDKSK